MGYWDDLKRPIESYPDDHRMANGRTPRHHARIQRYYKVLLKGRLIRQANEERINLFAWADRLERVAGQWYLAVRCRACGIEFPFSKDEELIERFYFSSAAEIVLGCPHCRMPLPYSGHKVTRIIMPDE
jgi:hypothetical protein